MKEPEDNPYVREQDTDFRELGELTVEEAEKQVEKLREAVEYHDYRYYVENNPVISDKAYDKLFDRLERLETEFDLTDPNSPTQRVGGEPIDEFETVEHVTEMMSIAASEDEEDVRDWSQRINDKVDNPKYHCEPKFDGLSVEVVYEDGEFVRAVTRGNGVEGDDISENVKTIRSVPLTLQEAPDFLVLRGEIYMPKTGFQELNKERVEQGKDPFANPRNAAAGTVRQLDPAVVADRPLDVFFYDVMDCSEDLETHEKAVKLMQNAGLRVSKLNQMVDEIDDFVEYRDELNQKREDLEYEIDGAVAKVNNFEQREKLGETSAHPRWAYAYKLPAKKEETVVQKIVVQVGRTGKLTPVALLEPVDVHGVTVSRATLHNASQVEELGVSEGAKVRVERAGDVIPEVVEVIEEKETDFEMPDECPACGSKVEKEGEYHFCTGGISCPAQLKRSLEHYSSLGAMDIEGIGEKVADQLVETGLVKEVPDLYQLEKKDLLELEKFGEKSAEKLLKEIEDTKTPELANFIFGLGIRHVGKETSRTLAQNFTLEELIEANEEELQELDDVGPQVAASIRSFFSGEGKQTVNRLRELGVEPERKEYGEELEGLKIVITGSIEGYTREELVDLLEQHGADVTSSVSSETDYLVVGENPGETKREKAEQVGVERIDAKEFRDRILAKIEN